MNDQLAEDLTRITPAHAGNTAEPQLEEIEYWDHPRTCGEYRESRH